MDALSPLIDIGERAASPAPVAVREMQAGDRARWDRFVHDECEEATFFHLSGWQAVIEKAFGLRTWFYYAEEAGQITGVLPLAEVDGMLFGHSLRALPFCVQGGIAARNARAAQALDAQAQLLADQLGVDYLEYRHERQFHSDWPMRDLYAIFRKRITADDAANMKAIPKKQRARIRKAEKCGLVSRVVDPVDVFDVYSRSLLRLGTPAFPIAYFRLLAETFGEQCHGLLIEHAQAPIVGVLSFFFRDQVLPYYGGGTAFARTVSGNDFMYWELMRIAAARGVRIYDFGRSKAGSGAWEFKCNWGFQPQPLYYEYRLAPGVNPPDQNPMSPKYRLLVKAWQRLPLWLANRIGPSLVRQLG